MKHLDGAAMTVWCNELVDILSEIEQLREEKRILKVHLEHANCCCCGKCDFCIDVGCDHDDEDLVYEVS